MHDVKANQYHDINHFPKDWGIIVLPVSMSRINNAQSPEACMNMLSTLALKIQDTKVGANFYYSDGLYMNFEIDAYEIKNRFAQNSVSHMRAIHNIRRKERIKFQIQEAFHFDSWFQMYLSHPDFFSVVSHIRRLYNTDYKFQEYIAHDAVDHKRTLDERQLTFYLEEFVFSYLLLHRQLVIVNEYVQHREKWILEVYPGSAPRGLIYLCQCNPLRFDQAINPYIGQYDSTQNHFIDFLKTNLDVCTPNSISRE